MPQQKEGAAGTIISPVEPTAASDALGGAAGATEAAPVEGPTRTAPTAPALSSATVSAQSPGTNEPDAPSAAASSTERAPYA